MSDEHHKAIDDAVRWIGMACDVMAGNPPALAMGDNYDSPSEYPEL